MKNRTKQRANRKKYCGGKVTDLRNCHGYIDATPFNATLSMKKEQKNQPMPRLINSVLIIDPYK